MKVILASFRNYAAIFLWEGGGQSVNDSNAVKSLPSLFRQMIKRREVEGGGVSWILGLLSWLPPICEGEEGGTS